MMKPIEIDDATYAFPASVIGTLLPAESDIPKQFWSDTEWSDIVEQWFFNGLNKETEFVAKDGIDPKLAFRHCSAVIRSYEPQHEHKVAGLSYLLSEFFIEVRNYLATKKSKG